MNKKIQLITASLMLALAAAGQNADSPYGVCAHFCIGEQWKLAEPKFRAMKPMGIEWVRNGFTWKEAEKAPGKWDYTVLDKAADALKKHQMNCLPILAYDVPWGHPACKHLDLWGEYVRRTVSRYPQFRYWEVWNEENYNESPGTKMSPDEYTKLLKRTAEIIRSIDPKIKIVFGGVAGVPADYIRKCIELGAADCFDVMNVHPYVSNYEPERIEKLMQPLLKLWKEKKLPHPIWVTEFSWPTHRDPVVANREYLTQALQYFKLDLKTCPAAVVRNPDLEALRRTPDFTLNTFPIRKEITYEQIKNLNVKEYPVLIPSLTQAFPRKYFSDVVDYVKRGGIIIHSFGLPFYCEAKQDGSGHWISIPRQDKSMLKRLHIDYLTEWQDKISGNGKLIPAPGIRKPVYHYTTGRRLSVKNLAPGDEFFPIYLQKNKDGEQPVAGIYRFNSDLKGGVIMDVFFRTGGVSEKVQGEYLPRAWILLQSMGVQKIFWYKFRAEERNPANDGCHFGIVHRDYTLRESGLALKFLITQMAPAGSSTPVIAVAGPLYHAQWQRPDKTKLHAFWTTGKVTRKVTLPFAAKQCWNHLGTALPLPKGELTIGSGIIYFEESKVNDERI